MLDNVAAGVNDLKEIALEMGKVINFLFVSLHLRC